MNRSLASPGIAALAMTTAVLLFAACGPSGSTSLAPSTSPTSSTSASPPASPAPSGAAGGFVVSLRVSGETYRVRLTDPADIAIARDLLAGKGGPRIPNGRVVRGSSDVNQGWSWHIDPDDFQWADLTIELCDGRPSFIERNEISGDRFCPWHAEVVGLEAAG